jgi:pentose-5-phosphate-3-epimerase
LLLYDISHIDIPPNSFFSCLSDKGYVLKQLKKKFNYRYDIGIDGGVNLETRPVLNDFDYLISGSYICMSNNYQDKIDSLR